MSETDRQTQVHLYLAARAPDIPDISPFCLKLATYMRMIRVPYQPCYNQSSSKGKYPWIKHKGKNIADSNFCIKYLNEAFGVDLDKDLTADQKALSHSVIRMVDEHFYWILAYLRYVVDNGSFVFKNYKFSGNALLNRVILWQVHRGMIGYLHSQGLGRHSMAEVYEIAREDLSALSTILGDKPYMVCNEPTRVDAHVFGQLAELLWRADGTIVCKMMNEEFTNLVKYVDRMRERYWKDDWAVPE